MALRSAFVGAEEKDRSSLYSTVDGNAACAHVVYALSEVALVYPMGDESLAKRSFSTQAIPNCRGSVCQVSLVDTTTGAGAAFLGAITANALTAACASSQSLLEMIPTLRLLALQRLPAVFHITASRVDSNLLVLPDLSDIFSVAQSGTGLLHSLTVQECHDMALVAHVAAQHASLPMIHFFDCQTSSELVKAKLLPHAKLAPLSSSLGKDTAAERPNRKNAPDIIDDVMNQLRRVLKRRYRLFEYAGSPNAENVLVSLCSGSATAALEAAVTQSCNQGVKVGLIKVRLLRPWSTKHFLQALPAAILKRCVVVGQLDQAATRLLYSDVLASIPHLDCQVHLAEFQSGITVASASSLLTQLAQKEVPRTIVVEDVKDDSPREPFQKIVSWDLGADSSALLDLAQVVGDNTTSFVHAAQLQNAYSLGGKITATHLHLAQASFNPPSDFHGLADVVTVQNVEVFKHYDVLARATETGKVLVNTTSPDTVPATNQRKLYLLDFTKINAEAPLVLQIAVLLLLHQQDGVQTVRDSFAVPLANYYGLDVQVVHTALDNVVANLKIVDNHSAAPTENLPATLSGQSLYSSARVASREASTVGGWHETAWRYMFPEAYEQKHAHGPSIQEQQFIIKVKENRRLTPHDYDRNVFHMELDISNTGLRYEIGDALGVYPHNQATDVAEFMSFYGLRANDTVMFHKDGYAEVRTVQHVLTQVLDLFGRPPRTFFSALAEFATNPSEKTALVGLGGEQKSAKWDAEYKKLSDEMVHYADVLRDFPSAHPSLVDLLRIVSPIKPRHYSIASAMSFKPSSVDLLVVVVEWKTRGKARYGSATRYLVDAKVGTEVTVSVKPSVMKLPADPLAPVLMAGLGTGMAPFRAFIQERVVQKRNGLNVGPMALYFGSRSQFEEYLYGEELEAYHASGLLTLLRCAFSRDQPKKVYIQHKIDEDGKVVHQYLANQAGQFYLCGPTWPCGDVQDAMTSAYQRYGNMSAEKAAAEIDLLKEHERYILEVY